MNVFESYLTIYRVSRIFGVAPYQIKTVKGRKIFRESKFLIIYSKILFIFYLLFSVYRGNIVKDDILRLKSLLARSFSFFGSFVGMIHFSICPLIFSKYSILLCKVQNRLNLLFIEIVDEKSEEIKKLRNINHFWECAFLLLISAGCFCNSIDYRPEWTVADFIKNKVTPIAYIPILYMRFSLALQFFAFLNILRLIYLSLNNKLLKINSKNLKTSILKSFRNTENKLKDILDDVNVVFSFMLFGFIVMSFIVIVTGVVLLITERETMMTVDFIAWISLSCFTVIAVISYVSLLSKEVKK